MSSTRALAEFSANLKYKDIPREVIDRTKLNLLDTLGCGVYGSRLPWSRILADFVKDLDGKKEATVWGQGFEVSSVNATLANGTFVHSFESDDYCPGAWCHAGSTTVPPAMAVAERVGGVSGEKFLTATVVGYEVQVRIGLCVSVSPMRRGWHTAGFNGAFGSAAACGKVLGLDENRMVNAIGIGGSLGAGLMAAQYAADVKRFHMGRAAQSGVMAALLAQIGFTGIPNVLEAEYGGYCATIADSYDLDIVTRDLGEKYELLNIVTLKPYPCNGSIQAELEAVEHIIQRRRIKPEAVKEIFVKVSDEAFQYIRDHVGWDYKPDTIMTAQSSLKYAIAAMIAENQVTVDQYTEEKIRDPQILELTRKVHLVKDAEMKGVHAALVEIHLSNGEILGHRVDRHKGRPPNPLTREDVVNKFRSQAKGILGIERVEEIVETVFSLEKLQDVALLSRMLSSQLI